MWNSIHIINSLHMCCSGIIIRSVEAAIHLVGHLHLGINIPLYHVRFVQSYCYLWIHIYYFVKTCLVVLRLIAHKQDLQSEVIEKVMQARENDEQNEKLFTQNETPISQLTNDMVESDVAKDY